MKLVSIEQAGNIGVRINGKIGRLWPTRADVSDGQITVVQEGCADYQGNVGEVEINGAYPDTEEACLEALEFLGNFRSGGGASVQSRQRQYLKTTTPLTAAVGLTQVIAGSSVADMSGAAPEEIRAGDIIVGPEGNQAIVIIGGTPVTDITVEVITQVGTGAFSRHTYLSDWVPGEIIPANANFDLTGVDIGIINHVEENVDMVIAFMNGYELHITNVDFAGTGYPYSIFHKRGDSIQYLWRSNSGQTDAAWNDLDNADIHFAADSKILTLKNSSVVEYCTINGEAIFIPALESDKYDLEDVYNELNERKQDKEEILPNLLDYAKGSIIPTSPTIGWDVESLVQQTVNDTKSMNLQTKEFQILLQNDSNEEVQNPTQQTKPGNQIARHLLLKSFDLSGVDTGHPLNTEENWYEDDWLLLYDDSWTYSYGIWRSFDDGTIRANDPNGSYVLFDGNSWTASFENEYLLWDSAIKKLSLMNPMDVWVESNYGDTISQYLVTYNPFDTVFSYRLRLIDNAGNHDVYTGGAWAADYNGNYGIRFSNSGGLTGNRKVLRFTGNNPSSIMSNTVSGQGLQILRTESLLLTPSFIWHTLRNRKASVDYVDDKVAEVEGLIKSWPTRVLTGTKNVSSASELTNAINELQGAYCGTVTGTYYIINLTANISVSALNILSFTGLFELALNSYTLTITGSSSTFKVSNSIGNFILSASTGTINLTNASSFMLFEGFALRSTIRVNIDRVINDNYIINVDSSNVVIYDNKSVGVIRLASGAVAYFKSGSNIRKLLGFGVVYSNNATILSNDEKSVILTDLSNTNNETFLRKPLISAPSTGTYVLKSVDGVLQWVEEI